MKDPFRDVRDALGKRTSIVCNFFGWTVGIGVALLAVHHQSLIGVSILMGYGAISMFTRIGLTIAMAHEVWKLDRAKKLRDKRATQDHGSEF